MPDVFRPALRAATSRGWRVLSGGATAAERRAAALARRSAQAAERAAPAVGEGPLPERGTVSESWSAAEPVGQEQRVFDLVDAQTGESRRVVRRPAPRYSPEATAEQSARAEALRRHAEARGEKPEDPRTWNEPGYDPTIRKHFKRLSEQPDVPPEGMTTLRGSKHSTPSEAERHLYEDTRRGVTPQDRELLAAFERKYGWQPDSPEHMRRMLSDADMEALIDAWTRGE